MRFSCAGHVMEGRSEGSSASPQETQDVPQKELAGHSARPASCAGHVLELLTYQSTSPPRFVRGGQRIGDREWRTGSVRQQQSDSFRLCEQSRTLELIAL